jgi:hypothetical protein
MQRQRRRLRVCPSGAQRVDCHMPSKTYMVVDARRDHSIRVPRPDLSVSLGTPNASPASEPAIKAALGDPDPLVRAAAPRALPGIPPPSFIYATAPLLSDPLRAVRIAAARALAGTDLLALTPEQQTALVNATSER